MDVANRELQARVANLKVTGAAVTASVGVIDARLIGKPDNFDGSDEKWRD